ncbi:MAG: hypothetical protein A2252_06080 [Elusimicrobia bacterium RIFOXYA2_FULL_39_19]|nr:MAG: hypothetical protein A2252_06080 [Elusimicrobia bacterium RIFOXYA2_FULL_39_19]
MNLLNLNFSLIFDPLSQFFVFLILLVSIPCAVYSIGYLKHHYSSKKILLAWFLLVLFVGSMLMVVTVSNALLFLIFWEIMSLVSFFFVVFDTEDKKSIKAGILYIIMTHLGTAFIVFSFLLMFKYANSFDYYAIKQACLLMPAHTKNVVFLFLLIGFGTKAGIVPVHIWLPYAHPQAPSHISGIMSGVMIKTAVYGIIRFIIYILGADTLWWGNLILILASISCLIGIMYALIENDIKKLLAYSSVENMGIILFGVGASMVFISKGLPVLAVLALSAGLYHLINHGIFKSLLFLGAGSVYKATGLRNIEKLGGLIKPMPFTAVSFLIGSMAISALPPLNGFASEWLTLQVLFNGALNCSGAQAIAMCFYAAVLAITGGLAAACFVKAFGVTFLGLPRSEPARQAREVPPLMYYPMFFLSALIVIFGLFSAQIFKSLNRISQSLYGVNESTYNFSSGSFVITPVNTLSCAGLSIPFIAVMLIAIMVMVYLAVRIFAGPGKVTRDRTWSCGYYKIDSRNAYTGTAFSKPFRIAFSFFYRTSRKTEEIKSSYYHVKSIKYKTSITPVFKKYIYDLIYKRTFYAAKYLSKFQSGSIHFYIACIFMAIVFLILFMNRF